MPAPEMVARSGDGKRPSERQSPPIRHPNPTTSLVGRDQEIAEVAELLRGNRLVTLTGPGGTGKTRLALAVAQRLVEEGDVVAFVDLASLESPEPVLASILASLGLRAVADKDPFDLIAQKVEATPHTLLLDNFEHVSAAASHLSDLLARSPGLRALVTSRKLLRIAVERVFEVPPLPVPSESERPDEMVHNPSVRLFLERAAEAGGAASLGEGELPIVAEICRRLAGLPLAIELAAARSRHLSVQALLGRLDEPLPLLSGGPIDAPARHRALRHTIGWSYDLLDADSARFFGDLGVFRGSFGLEAAHHVARDQADPSDSETLDRLTELADQSLLRAIATDDDGPRFVMHDAITDFALTVVDDETAVRRRHLDYYLGLVERAEPQLEGADQTRWTRILVTEQENLRGALDWAYRSSSSVALLRLAAALGNFWRWHGDLREGREWLSRAALAAQPGHEALVAKVQRRAARIYDSLGERTQARHLYDSARRNSEAAEDAEGVAESLVSVGHLLLDERRLSEAEPFVVEGLDLARSREMPTILAPAILTMANLKHSQGLTAEAIPLYQEAAGVAKSVGNVRLAAVALVNLADTELIAGHDAAAVPLLAEGIAYLDQIEDLAYLPWACLVLGLARRKLGDMDEARVSIARGARLALEVASPVDLIFAAEAMADWLGAAGARQDALTAWAAAAYAREDLDLPRQPTDDAWINEGMERDRTALSKSAATEAWGRARESDLRGAVEQALEILGVVPLSTRQATSHDRYALTRRELEVLPLLVQGLSDTEIADELFISPKTASVHVANIKGKLGSSSRVETVTRAVAMGLVAIPGGAPD